MLRATDHSNPHAKKKMYDFIHKLSPGVAPFQSPYHAMLEALDKVASLRVTGLLLEVRLPAIPNTTEILYYSMYGK